MAVKVLRFQDGRIWIDILQIWHVFGNYLRFSIYTIPVQLERNDGLTFRGFLIQARDQDNYPIGMFLEDDHVKTICPDENNVGITLSL